MPDPVDRPSLHLVESTEYVITPRASERQPASVAEVAAAGHALQQATAVALERAVVRLRRHGGTWRDVGRALGISRQAAHKRFKHAGRGGLVELTWMNADPDGTFMARCTFLDEEIRLGSTAAEHAARRDALVGDLATVAAGQVAS